MADKDFRVVISALDKATAPLVAFASRVEAVNRRIVGVQGRLAKPFRDSHAAAALLGTELTKLSSNTGLTRIASAAGTAAARVGDLGRRLGGVMAPLAAIGGLASVAGLTAIVRDAVTAASALKDMRARVGALSPDQRFNLGALRYSAQQTGGSPDAALEAVATLRANIFDAARGKNDNVRSAMRSLGVRAFDGRGRMRNALDLVPEIARAIAAKPEMQRESFTRTIFGNGNLLPALMEFRENADRFRRHGRVFSDQEIDALDEAGDSFTDLQLALNGLSNAIGAKVAPALTGVVNRITDIITANREWMAQGVGDYVQRLATSLEAVNWTEFWGGIEKSWQGLRDLAKWADDALKPIGGLETALVALVGAVVLGPFIASIVSLGSALVALTAALMTSPIGGAVAAIGALGLAFWGAYEAAKAFLTLFPDRGQEPTERQREQGQRMGRRGELGGFPAVPLPPEDGEAPPGPGRSLRDFLDFLLGPSNPPVPVPGASGPRRVGRPGRNGAIQPQSFNDSPLGSDQVAVVVRFENAPEGMRARAETRGVILARPEIEVGYAFGIGGRWSRA